MEEPFYPILRLSNNYSNQDSVVLAEVKTQQSMDNIENSEIDQHECPTDFWLRSKHNSMKVG